MKKSNIIIAGSIIFLSVLFLSLSKTGPFKGKPLETAQAQTAPGGHAGHGGGTPAPQPATKPEAAESEETPTVEIPLDKQQLIGVKTAVVSLKPFQKVIRTVGRVEIDEKKIATVNTKFEGWIEKLHADYTGKFIKKGEPLAEIYSPELYATQQEFINLLKWSSKAKSSAPKSEMGTLLSKDAESVIEAAKQRLKLWDITDEQIKKIEETGKPVRTLTLYSPVNGHLIQKTALEGMRVMPGDKLFDMADLSTVWIIADIYEYELPLIDIGQQATISLSYFPGKEFTSKIEFVYPTLAGETRTAKVRFSVPNPEGRIKPQMYTDVTIKSRLEKRLIIPEDAVIDSGTRQIVYIDKGEGYFEPREIAGGLRAGGMIEVLRGLRAGEKIATSANFLIDSEAKLKGVAAPAHKH